MQQQFALLKGGRTETMSKEFVKLDFSRWQPTKVGEIIEVKIPYLNAEKSAVKLTFKERFFEAIKSILNKIKGKKDPFLEFKNELKNLNIPENEIKIQIENEFLEGVLSENNIKPSDNEQRTYIQTNAA